MSHVEEGTLHAYLDGELTSEEVTALERHLSVCVPCRNALAEARGFLAEADGLVLALDVVTPATPAAPPAAVPVVPITGARRPRLTTLAWAASLIAAVGLGYSLRNSPVPLEEFQTGLREAPATAPVVASETPAQAEPRAPRPAPATPAARDESRQSDGPAYRSFASNDPQPSAAKTTGELSGGSTTALERSNVVAQQSPAPAAGLGSASPSARSDATPNLAYIQGVPVDTTRARRNFGPATTGEPIRITMDEAVNRLGGSIQLIDGLSPQRVEVVAGVDVVGADPSREVIRIYYEEPDLGLVTLDQQRPAPSFAFRNPPNEISPEAVTTQPATLDSRPSAARRGTAPEVATLYWRADGVWLALTSRLTKEQMGKLQARVR